MPRRRRPAEPEARDPEPRDEPAPSRGGPSSAPAVDGEVLGAHEVPEADVEVLDAEGRNLRPGDPELLERRRVVARLMALGVTRHQLQSAMLDQGWEVSDSQAKRDYEVVLRTWSEEHAADLSQARAAQARRLHSDLARLRQAAMTTSTVSGTGKAQRSKPNHRARVGYWRAVYQAEALLARISGHLAPVEVRVDHRLAVRDSLLDVVASMSPDELDEIAAEQLALEAGGR